MPQTLSPAPSDMPQEVIDFRTRTIMPDYNVDQLWSARKGFLEAAVAGALANITARLRKRYKTPFTAAGGINPRPEIVVTWQAQLVTPLAYRALGMNPQDPTMQWAEDDRKRAFDEIKEAADAVDGLYDLPLLDTGEATGIAAGGPLGTSEPSPYDWTDAQALALTFR